MTDETTGQPAPSTADGPEAPEREADGANGTAEAGEGAGADLPAAQVATEATETVTPSSAAPALDDTFHPRHPNALKMELALGGLFIAAATLASFAVATALTVSLRINPLLFLVAAALPLILALPCLALPRWRHRRYRYRADDRGLEIHQGIWWRSRRFIPRSRLQHTDVAQGPLERRFGIANLIVHTAGTHEAKTTLSGLGLETAREVRERLTGESGAGVDRDGDSDGV